jgi:hypothetical protein
MQLQYLHGLTVAYRECGNQVIAIGHSSNAAVLIAQAPAPARQPLRLESSKIEWHCAFGLSHVAEKA